MKAFLPVAVGLFGLLANPAALRAEEKNGVSIVVTKKTLERNDTRSPYAYSSDRIDRTQGLKATIRNTSIKPQPEGEVKWMILVRRYNYSPSELQGTTGTEKLKALNSLETAEMVLGATQITGYSGYDAAKDKMEYQIIVSQEGVEKVRIQSTAGFDALAKRARMVKSDGSGDSSADSGKTTTRTTTNPSPAATPKPVAAATPRPSTAVPANPFAAPRATPAPTPKPSKPSADADAPLDGSKLK